MPYTAPLPSVWNVVCRVRFSYRSPKQTEETGDWKYCLSNMLVTTIFPAILGTDKAHVPTPKQLRQAKFAPKRAALLAFMQAFTKARLPEVPFGTTELDLCCGCVFVFCLFFWPF